VLFFLAPITGAIALGVFAIAAIISRTISIASLSAFIVSAAFHPIFYPTEAYVVFLVALVLLVIYRHESNLDALIQGSENRF
jgi:glycerol-3-phosphate acyltransferase PlsY